MSSRRFQTAAVLGVMLVGGALLLGGCSGNPDAKYQAIKDDLTPNLDTLYQRPEDVDNALVITADENGRMFWQDVGRAWYVDRPSRLSREPKPRP